MQQQQQPRSRFNKHLSSVTVQLLQSKPLSVDHINSMSPNPCPLPQYQSAHMATIGALYTNNVIYTLKTNDNNQTCNVRCNESWDTPVYSIDGEDCVPPHIRVTVFEASSYGRHQWLQQLRLLQLAEKTQRGAPDELIRMLQVLSSHFICRTAFTSACQQYCQSNSKQSTNLLSSLLNVKPLKSVGIIQYPRTKFY